MNISYCTPDRFYSADVMETFYMLSRDEVMFVIDQKKPIRLSDHEHDAYERLVFAEQKRAITHIHKNFILNMPHPVNLIH